MTKLSAEVQTILTVWELLQPLHPVDPQRLGERLVPGLFKVLFGVRTRKFNSVFFRLNARVRIPKSTLHRPGTSFTYTKVKN